jgi:fatty-acyl-CoA synthase
MTPTVQLLLRNAFARYRDRVCLTWEGGHATYAQTEARAGALATWLQAGVPREGHIGILLPNGRAFVEAILACAMAGRVRVALNDRETPAAIAAKVGTAECALLITDERGRERLAAEDGVRPPVLTVDGPARAGSYARILDGPFGWGRIAAVRPEERFRLTFSGGTTGVPKGVVQTHRQELAVLRNLLLEVYRPAAHRVFVAATPMSHASGSFVIPTVVGGGCLAWTERFAPERLVDTSWLDGAPKAQTFLVPTALDDVSHAVGAGGHSLQTVIYGGAPCGAATLERAVEAIGPRLVQIYGQVEVPMTVCVVPPEEHADPAQVAGCLGRPFLHVDVALERDGERIEQPGAAGELVVRADHVMEGYWREPEATAERLTPDGGLKTEDVGSRDEAGRIWLVGRMREMLISGGYNVFPAEVESRLGAVEGVQELAVFGVPHPRWTEAVAIAVVGPPTGGTHEQLRRAIAAAANERLAAYERPKVVVIVDSLPQTPLGKVSRADLAETYRDTFTGDG